MAKASAILRFVLLATACCAAPAWGQATKNKREPHIGYVYPAGGQRGTRFQMLIGGQNLRGAADAYVSGSGVQARVIQHYRPLMNLDTDQRQALQRHMRDLFEKQLAKLPPDHRERIPLGEFAKPAGIGKGGRGKKEPAASQAAALPEHPILLNLDGKSLRGLLDVRDELTNYRKRQPNMQIAESVLIEVTIDRKAAPGDREIRLGTRQELTNPLRFQVGTLPETREEETNDPGEYPFLPPQAPLDVPIVLNGQIKPGDVDRVAFRARKGQRLVIQMWARQLIPYLADAVPGWFQATLAVYDSSGRQVAFSDDFRFDPDPLLYFQVPEDGVYELEVHDSIYRGRDDFVYRVALAQQPFVTDIFPLGGRTGARTLAEADGWNLGEAHLPLATPPGTTGVRQTTLKQQGQLSNPVTYAVDMLPESTETEPNDAPEHASPIDLPRIINGRIDAPGDVDSFSFEGRAGQEVVAEVNARRLNSPLDSLLQLIDSSGQIMEWNDDREQKESGLLTHHADSYLRAKLPEDGTYRVRLSDAQRRGGPAYGYRLRISAPRPDFGLRATPSSLTLRAGSTVPITVYALRKDGFDGEVQIVPKDAPDGFVLSKAIIPAGQDHATINIQGPPRPLNGPVALELEGVARIGNQTVRREVTPAEDMMQAFAYQHLVPSQELLVLTVGNPRPAPRDQALRKRVK
jgi:hypothetical protein